MKRFIFLSVLVVIGLMATRIAIAQTDFSLSIQIAPPELLEYAQPMCPADGYIWTPGYWAYDFGEYYWVPGVWVYPPQVGYLWTPSYWEFSDGYYGWHPGYWGESVGFYGGVNYGYGYSGYGFSGGRWEGKAFHYNTAVMNVSRSKARNTYQDRTAIHDRPDRRPSFSGTGGNVMRPDSRELLEEKNRHVSPTQEQFTHQVTASRDRNQFSSVNRGRSATVAMNSVNGTRYHQKPAPSPTRGPAGNTPKNNNRPANPRTVAPTRVIKSPQRENPAPVRRDQPDRQRAQPAQKKPEQHAAPRPQTPVREKKK